MTEIRIIPDTVPPHHTTPHHTIPHHTTTYHDTSYPTISHYSRPYYTISPLSNTPHPSPIHLIPLQYTSSLSYIPLYTPTLLRYRYAQVSKRVNIQRLKSDIWGSITNQIVPDASSEPAIPSLATLSIADTEDTENSQANGNINTIGTDGEISYNKAAAVKRRSSDRDRDIEGVRVVQDSMSFQHMISSIATNPRQKDVSLPFYFICLLHLANENVRIMPSRCALTVCVPLVCVSLTSSMMHHCTSPISP